MRISGNTRNINGKIVKRTRLRERGIGGEDKTNISGTKVLEGLVEKVVGFEVYVSGEAS